MEQYAVTGFLLGVLSTGAFFLFVDYIPYENKLHSACKSVGQDLVKYDQLTIYCTNKVILER